MDDLSPGSSVAVRPECVCALLRMTTRSVTQLYDTIMRPSGLRVTQYSLLTNIERRGRANVSALTTGLAMDQTTVTKNLLLLERQGFVERVPHADARVKQVRVTAIGREKLRAGRRLWGRAQERVLAELGRRQWRQMQARLWHLMEIVRRPPASRRDGRSSYHQHREIRDARPETDDAQRRRPAG